MEYNSIRVSNKNACASLNGWVLIHEVQEEKLVKRKSTHISNCMHFSNEILVTIAFGKCSNFIQERFLNMEHIKVFHEFGKWLFEVVDNWSPPIFKGIFKVDFVSQRGMANDWSDSWNNSCRWDSQNGGQHNQSFHHILILSRNYIFSSFSNKFIRKANSVLSNNLSARFIFVQINGQIELLKLDEIFMKVHKLLGHLKIWHHFSGISSESSRL